MSFLQRLTAVVILIASLTHCGAAELRPPDNANVAYGPHARHVLDFWKASAAKGPTPLVVFIHGGGFRSGDKRDFAKPQYVEPLLAADVSCASINYRYTTDATVPDILRDCARAVQFLRSRAEEWNIDSRRVAGWGGSAGACAVMWLGTHDDLAQPTSTDPVLRQSSRLSAVVLAAPQATLNPLRWESFVEPPQPQWRTAAEELSARNFGVKQFSDLKSDTLKPILTDCDALHWLDKSDAVFFCINVTPDGPAKDFNHWAHHPRHAAEIRRCCEAAGVACTVSKQNPSKADAEAIEFLKQHLKSHNQRQR